VKNVTKPLTAKGAATRERIVTGAAILVRADGVERTGLDDVLAAPSTSKGQLFHYFPGGRSDLLYAVAQHEVAQVIGDQQPYLDELGPHGSWKAWRDVVVERYRVQGAHCPLSALTSQLRQTDPRIAPLIVDLLHDWHARIEAGVRRARLTGDLDQAPQGTTDDHQDAGTILTAIQGGASLLITTGEIGYLEAAMDASITNAGLT
jgi:AcrR family transcriptional regulator